MQSQAHHNSRRSFLKGMGTTMAGVAVAGTMGFASHSLLGAGQAGAAITGDFPYKKLDKDIAAEMAFKSYMERGG
ncbi:twin-arginine translocation signal domain-containing protein [Desulfonatronospira sp.]|uniref:twin-arginine translocation signal domain-containing protein n=1 Tax=Desulfonatronospira sp. TaxID=1962951 RepID=UPI0025BB993C|nr:twin-arginine translocation signal domain-containing protein [Desulfonatronospira sp.]